MDSAAAGFVGAIPVRPQRPDNELPAVLATQRVLVRTADIAVVLAPIHVYTNGFELRLDMVVREELDEPGRPGLLGSLLVGLDYRDGRTATSVARHPFGAGHAPQGVALSRRGGSSSSLRAAETFFGSPLPPPTAVDLVVALPRFEVPETVVELDGAAISRAAQDAVVLWPEPVRRPQPDPLPPPPLPAGGWFAANAPAAASPPAVRPDPGRA